MAKKTPLDKLDAAVKDILETYGDEVAKNTNTITKRFAKEGAKAVKGEAKANKWGETTGYDKGWTSQVEETRYSIKAAVFNKDKPGLTHLLEKGHVMRNGQRSKAYPHIAPVEEKLVNEYVKAVEGAI